MKRNQKPVSGRPPTAALIESKNTFSSSSVAPANNSPITPPHRQMQTPSPMVCSSKRCARRAERDLMETSFRRR